ncbi:alpha-L-iduronidase [Lingula anatina]|uniref:Alpha-L-iduronidase n=1 Tax=Lingula anatina TaxID=7574 RepID=A0A1S3HTJ5_LINAN|nr:alpha-L-iduronidase [Lingula anatina]|eukprot:XP_013389365.1 alpha-L-iduronidase [Lingula anatina]
MHFTLYVVALLFCSILISQCCCRSTYKVKIDEGKIIANLSHFWESTGFCPPAPHQDAAAFDLGTDMLHNLAYIAAVPNGGIKQVRVHWLLDLVKVQGVEGRFPVYNFSHLDQFIEMLIQLDLQPGFEIMGNPGNFFTDFENNTQIYAWRDMVAAIAKRYVDYYGEESVSKWKFETWNEPDLHDFDNLTFTMQGYLNYYDACSEGLKAASPELKLGAPGGVCREPESRYKLCWGLFKHVVSGTNYFTGERGVRLDFISFHKKGGKRKQHMGKSQTIMESELDLIQKIHTRTPKLKHIPIINDEADPMTGWSEPEQWRADATYGAVVAKVIAEHQNLILSKKNNSINYQLLSNDNGFLNYYPNYFTQRTLLARFQVNNTQPPHTQFIRKPGYSVMGMLALLGEHQVQAQVTCNGLPLTDFSRLGVLASIHIPYEDLGPDSWQFSALVYNSNDTSNATGFDLLEIHFGDLKPPSSTDLMWVQYILDNSHGNPSSIWEKQGKPIFPSVKQFKDMRDNEGPVRVSHPAAYNTTQSAFKWKLPLPGVVLFHICAKPKMPPNQVTNVIVTNITSNQVLVTWSDSCVHSRCLLTYEVELSTHSSGTLVYHRINPSDTIFTMFVFAPDESDSSVFGLYRVRAVDFWGRFGQYSLPAQYPQKNIEKYSTKQHCSRGRLKRSHRYPGS